MNTSTQTKPATYSEKAGLGHGPVSLEPYRSEEFYKGERERMFGRAWLLAGRSEEIPKPGDYFLKEVDVCQASVLIVHGKDGKIRAFHNVCPHRGNQLVSVRAGSSGAFSCRYHSWTFASDGALRGVPDEEMFIGLDKKACGLTPVALEEWDGWLFINLAREPEVSLEFFLGDFKAFYEGVRYVNPERPVIIETHLNCNWKVVMDAFAEAYHIPTLHRATLKTIFSNSDNMFGRPLDTNFFGPHAANSMFGNPEYMPQSNQLVEILAYNPAHVAEDHRRDIGEYLSHQGINPTRTKKWSMDVNYIFPNTHLNANYNGFFVHQFWPVGIDRTRHEARFYLRQPRNIRERFAQEHTISHAVDIVLEDVSNVERTQRGINSRGTASMHLSESEILIRHSLHHIRRWVESESVAVALGQKTDGGAK